MHLINFLTKSLVDGMLSSLSFEVVVGVGKRVVVQRIAAARV